MVSTSNSSVFSGAIIAKLNKKIAKGFLNSSGEMCYFIDIVLPIDKIDGVNTLCDVRLGVDTEPKKSDIYNLYLNISIGTSKYDQKEDIFYKYLGMKVVKKQSALFGLPPSKQSEEYRFALADWLTLKLNNIQKLITRLRVSPQRDRLITNYAEEEILWEATKKFCIEIEKKSVIKTKASKKAASASASGAAAGTSEAAAGAAANRAAIEKYSSENRIEPSFKECCVCAEETTNKTPCKHHICIVCLSRLNKQKCPICRGTMYAEDEEEDDDEDEDDDDDEDDLSEEEEEEENNEPSSAAIHDTIHDSSINDTINEVAF
jgi:hypothetical protein